MIHYRSGKGMERVDALLNPMDGTPDVAIRIEGSDEFISVLKTSLFYDGVRVVGNTLPQIRTGIGIPSLRDYYVLNGEVL